VFWKVPDKPPDRKFIVLAHSNIDSNVRTTIELLPNLGFLSLEEPTMSLVKIIVITVLIILSILLFGRFLF